MLLFALVPAGGAAGLERAIFEAVNRERARRRLKALAWDEAVAEAARAHSGRMRDLNFFSHTDPQLGDARQRLRAAGLHWSVWGENLYQEQGMPDPVRSAVQSWMSSPAHRRNVLHPVFARTGVGVAARGRSYWFTQVFVGGRRR
ncbi:MAG: CAP domain-containing protein [Bryobacteraceae bacterium]